MFKEGLTIPPSFLYSLFVILCHTVFMQEVVHTGFLSRLGSSFVGALVGLLLFFASFFVLWINEGVQKDSLLVERAKPILTTEVSSVSPDTYGTLFAIVGTVSGVISKQGDFIATTSFIALDRLVETYAWQEVQTTSEERHIGGSATSTTSYSYEKRWQGTPQSSDQFSEPQGHTNIPSRYSSFSLRSDTLSLGTMSLSTGITLPHLPPVILTSGVLGTTARAQIVENGHYLFVSRDGASSYQSPKIGDNRLSFFGIPRDSTGTVVGTISDQYQSTTVPSIVRYVGKHGSIFSLYPGRYEEALATARSQDATRLWLFRGIGFFIMFMGLLFISRPLSIFLDIIPIFGSISRFLSLISSFVVAFVLSTLTIIVSLIAHNVWILSLVLITALLAILWYFKKKGKSARRASSK